MKKLNKPFKVFLLNLDNPFVYKFKKIDIDRSIYNAANIFALTKKPLNYKEINVGERISNRKIAGLLMQFTWEGNKLFAKLFPTNILWNFKIKKMLKKRQGIFRIQGLINRRLIEDGTTSEGLEYIHNFYIEYDN